MLSRRRFHALGLFALSVPTAAATAEPQRSLKARLIVQTFLQAQSGQRADLGKFIELNWLAMDRQGIDQGIFTHAVLHEAVSTDVREAGRPVDYVVEVGYPTAGGYADAEAQFLKIRKAHKIILVNGRGLGELGLIVGERQFRPVASA